MKLHPKETEVHMHRRYIPRFILAEDKRDNLLADLLETRVTTANEMAKNDPVSIKPHPCSYALSHDLRAPLRHIDGYAKILEEDYAQAMDITGRHAVSNIIRNAQRMTDLIDGLLMLARYDNVEMSYSNIDMNALVQRVVRKLKTETPERSVDIRIRPLPPAYGDKVMLALLWKHLIGNSIKFTSKTDRSQITIGSEEKGSYVITDNGAGFDQQYSAKLFHLFQRLHAPPDFEGTGIGLALAAKIVSRHGGSISGEGRVNEGARFSFRLKTRS